MFNPKSNLLPLAVFIYGNVKSVYLAVNPYTTGIALRLSPLTAAPYTLNTLNGGSNIIFSLMLIALIKVT